MPISCVKYIFIYNFILCISSTTFAQDGNYTHYLARQFAENGEFAKAAEYYAELYAEEDGLLYYQ